MASSIPKELRQDPEVAEKLRELEKAS